MIRPVLASLVFLGLGAAASAAGLAPYTPPGTAYHTAPGVAPPCNSEKMLGDVQERFDWANRRTWRTSYEINAFDLIRETRHALGPGLVERRYCEAAAILNDGQRPIVYYMIETQQGLAGIGSRVEFCLVEQDYWRVHDGDCRTVRPQ